MTIQNLLFRLEKVKQTNPQSWIARCPAHTDKSPSLSIRELQDGKVLIHCFSGCDIQAIVSAIELNLSDLFPNSDQHYYQKPLKQKITGPQAFELTYYESLVILEVAKNLLNKKICSDSDMDRLKKAFDRINAVHNFYRD
jgi:hypothetical protein